MKIPTFGVRIHIYFLFIFLFMTPMLLSGQDCDLDTDGDLVCQLVDNCPDAFNPRQADSNGDGVGDVCSCDAEAFSACEMELNICLVSANGDADDEFSCQNLFARCIGMFDNSPPQITCSSLAPTYTDSSEPTWVTIPPPIFGDNCGVRWLVNDYTSLSNPMDWTLTSDASANYQVGTTTVTWTVYDLAGNFTDCFVDVQVIEGPDPNAIPTLSQWGLIILSLIMLVFGVVALKDRHPIAYIG